jgi:CO/xanthine dehydrogenase FAD-binding subunit
VTVPFCRPRSVQEACQLLAEDVRRVPIAGGTDLMVRWPQRLDAHALTYVDLSPLRELRPIAWSEDALRLGGLTTYWDVIQDRRVGEEFPLLVRAARQIGAIQIQARGTWAGNIANASPAADGVAVLLAYDAVVELRSCAGDDEVPLADFYLGYKQMRKGPDQLIRAIRLPRRRRSFELFEKVGSRTAQAIAKVGVAVVRSASGWRVVASSMGPCVCRCPQLEALLEAGTAIGTPQELLPALRSDVSPIDDLRSTAEYREAVMARVLFFGLRNGAPLPRLTSREAAGT